MNRNVLVTMLVAILALAGCRSAGVAATPRAQIYRITINAPKTLAEGASADVDVVLTNRDVSSVHNILTDVEVPPQLAVLDQTSDREVTATHEPGANLYHFAVVELPVRQEAHIYFHIRTAFGTATQTGEIRVTSWQQDLPANKLFQKAVIGLAKWRAGSTADLR